MIVFKSKSSFLKHLLIMNKLNAISFCHFHKVKQNTFPKPIESHQINLKRNSYYAVNWNHYTLY